MPAVGVTVQEGQKLKNGGIDYYKQFGKTSKYDYDKLRVKTKQFYKFLIGRTYTKKWFLW